MSPSAGSRSLCSSMQSAVRRVSSSSTSSSILRSKRVIVERSDAVLRSKRCFAASLPSESFKEEKRRNRISKRERREMLEAFVDRYRALNAGKFPTVSHAQKEVGGSFYVVREIIQELEYSHKMSPRKPEKPTEFGVKTDISADTGESPTIKDAVAVGSFEVEVPLISTDSEKTFVYEPASHSTIEIIHSGEQIAEGIENSEMSGQISSDDVHIDSEGPKKDSPLRLVKESGKDTVSEPIEFQEIDYEVPKDSPLRLANKSGDDNVQDPIEYQADASVPLRLDTEVDILSTPVNDVQGTTEDKSSTVCAEEEVKMRSNEEVPAQGTIEYKSSAVCAEEEVNHRSNVEVSKSEKHTSDSSRTLEDASPPKGSSIWGNLRSLADEFILAFGGKSEYEYHFWHTVRYYHRLTGELSKFLFVFS